MSKTGKKLHLGCGSEILEGWVNHDLADLPGVDVVHDLNSFPWPFPDNEFSELKAINLLEHLPETVRVIEEIHRVCADGAKVVIRVPYWNSPDMITDPTHRVFFNQFSLDYFDESRVYCQRRPYYSKARFHIDSIGYYIRFFRYWLIKNALLKMPLSFLSRYLGGIIWVLEFEMTAEKK